MDTPSHHASTRDLSLSNQERWRAYLHFLGIFLAVFVPIYVGSGHLLTQLPDRSIHLLLEWEKSIPLIPWMIWPYLSLFSLYALPLLHMNEHDMKQLSRQSVVAILVAGIFFISIPTKIGFSPVVVTGLHESIFRLIASVDTPFNLVPSLHVAGATLVVLGCVKRVGIGLARIYQIWLATLMISTVLVHQHHIIDAFAGFILALTIRRAIPISGPVTADA
ncbi:MAG: Ser/Thr and Tyr protein phosphatase (dual specificity) [Comamonadaceae bacterium]|nr:MAG: Ser/Thr and Tyr protein phosphatase (dual specificity) [Comamonadaceae bacterium]